MSRKTAAKAAIESIKVKIVGLETERSRVESMILVYKELIKDLENAEKGRVVKTRTRAKAIGIPQPEDVDSIHRN